MLDRRRFLLATLAQGVVTLPGVALARAETDRRLVVIVLRGALDGLHAVVPYGEHAYSAARRQLALGPSPDDGTIKLDGLFALHASLARTAQLYARGEALVVHAVASSYRGRSHFDAQNVLESGVAKPYARRDGWVGRLLPLLHRGGGLAVTPSVPLLLRGSSDVATYVPSRDEAISEGLLDRVTALYAEDKILGELWLEALRIQGMAGDRDSGGRRLKQLAAVAGRFLARQDGPRVAVLESHGWDTHTNQVVRLERKLANLDAAIAALQTALGASWPNALILVITEFGRTVAANGTGGTDHGTASTLLMAGGAVRGGRVVADWPGLGAAALYEGRDLMPTTDMHAVLTSALSDFFALDPAVIARRTFPDLPAGRSWEGLIHT